jgi:hypothetical protein
VSLITVVRDVCAVVGVAAPTSVFAGIGTNRTMFEMLSCANEMAQRIACDTRDWQVLRKRATLVGDGATAAFPLPADYKRMLLTGNVWRTSDLQQPMCFQPDTDEWLRRREANEGDNLGEWTMYGGLLHIDPVLEAGVDAWFPYLEKNCIALAPGGAPSDRFLSDDDTFRIDERILKLGMIADWKEKKGSPYAEAMGTYSDAVSNVMGHDKPAPIIIRGRAMSRGLFTHANY